MQEFYFKLTSMEVLQFATLSDQFPIEDTSGHIQINYLFDPLSHTLICRLSFLLSLIAYNTPVLKAEMKSGFEIKEESLDQITKGNEISFPVNLLAHFASLTYSSLRGVILAKTENTPFNGFILPVQDMQAHITTPYVYKEYRATLDD